MSSDHPGENRHRFDALVYLAAVVLAFVLLVTGHPWWIVAVALVAAVLLRPEAGR